MAVPRPRDILEEFRCRGVDSPARDDIWHSCRCDVRGASHAQIARTRVDNDDV
jgi:hypothetical protein